MKYKIHNIDQKTEEWLSLRKGKMTASNATAIGNCGKGLETYIKNLMAEYYSHGEKEQFTSVDIERGNTLEAEARNIYELETGNHMEQVGFLEVDSELGCSPDGVNFDLKGGLEIKCPNDKNYFELLTASPEYRIKDYNWQVQMNLLITGFDWWDLVIYNPNFDKSIIITRIFPDKEKQEDLQKGIKKGREFIKSLKDKYNNFTNK